MKTLSLRSLFQRALCALVGAGPLALAPSVHAQSGVFASLFHPLGIAVTQQGQIVAYSDYNLGGHGYTFYQPNGQLIGQVPVGGASSGWNLAGQIANRTFGGAGDSEGLCKLTVVPSWGGLVLGLRTDGGLVWYDPKTGEKQYWINLRLLPTNVSQMYDVAQGRYTAGLGQVSNVGANYGDLAVFRGRDWRGRPYTVIYATGLSLPGIFPFVQRVRLYDDQRWDSKIIVTSLATSAGALNNARGIAVNAAGTVAAMLSAQTNAGAVDRLFMFGQDFDENGRNLPTLKLGGAFIGGEGLCADRYGNFLIATGKFGITFSGGHYPGALVMVGPTGALKNIYPVGGATPDTRDVAVSTDGRYAYVVAYQNSAILRVQLF